MKKNPLTKVIEVVGIPGSGKSFISRSLNKIHEPYTSLLSLNTSVLSRGDIIRTLNDSRYWLVDSRILNISPKSLINYFFNSTIKFHVANHCYNSIPSYRSLLNFIENVIVPDELNSTEKIAAFTIYLSRVYKEVLPNNLEKCIIEDGGFMFRASYFNNYTGEVDAEMLSQYLKFIPYFPDKIIRIKVCPYLAIERILARKDSVIPYFLRGLDFYSEGIERLRICDSNLDTLISMIPDSISIVEIDGGLDPVPLLNKIFQ